MKAALHRIDVVGKRKELLGKGVVVLDGHFDLDVAAGAFDKNRGMQTRMAPVEIFDELYQAALIVKLVFLIPAVILDDDAHTFVKKGQFAHSPGQNLVGELGGREDLRVGDEVHLGAALGGGADHRQIRRLDAPGIALPIDLALGINFHLQQGGQRVDHRNPNTVESPRHLVGMIVEFAPGVKTRHDDFHGRDLLDLVNAHRYPATVIGHADAVVRVDHDIDGRAVAGHSLVDAVVHNLVNQVVESGHVDVADVHGGPFTDGFEPFQDFDIVFVVGLIDSRIHIRMGIMTLKNRWSACPSTRQGRSLSVRLIWI